MSVESYPSNLWEATIGIWLIDMRIRIDYHTSDT